MESSFRKSQHSYRVSYALEVGSSFDPDLEDVAKWEEELGTISFFFFQWWLIHIAIMM